MKIHFIIKNKDIKEDYFAEAEKKDNQIIFEKNNVKTVIKIEDDIFITRTGEMKYYQRFSLNKLIKGEYEILGYKINISVYTKILNINKYGIFIEYDQYIDDKFESTIKIYLKF